MNITARIRAVQSALGVTVDGAAGPKTWAAIYDRVVGDAPQEQPADDVRVDDRSEANIATLLPDVRPYARALIHSAAHQGIVVKIISGTRSYAEQNALYEQGRSKPGAVVTNARGGYSNHNFGIAFDVGIFDGGRYLEESPIYKAVGAIGKSLGLEWGGDWRTIQDEPHFQLRPKWAKNMSERDMLAELRRRKGSGVAVFA